MRSENASIMMTIKTVIPKYALIDEMINKNIVTAAAMTAGDTIHRVLLVLLLVQITKNGWKKILKVITCFL